MTYCGDKKNDHSCVMISNIYQEIKKYLSTISDTNEYVKFIKQSIIDYFNHF